MGEQIEEWVQWGRKRDVTQKERDEISAELVEYYKEFADVSIEIYNRLDAAGFDDEAILADNWSDDEIADVVKIVKDVIVEFKRFQ